jgi:hypothetical protein
VRVRLAALLVLLLASVVGAGEDEDAAPTTFEAARKELSRLHLVEGEVSGYLDGPGEFFRLSRAFLELGGYERLLKSESTIERAMGLYCLSQARKEKAVPVLLDHLGDSAPIVMVPFG